MSSKRLRGGTWDGRVHGGWWQASYWDGMPGLQSQACDVCQPGTVGALRYWYLEDEHLVDWSPEESWAGGRTTGWLRGHHQCGSCRARPPLQVQVQMQLARGEAGIGYILEYMLVVVVHRRQRAKFPCLVECLAKGWCLVPGR